MKHFNPHGYEICVFELQRALDANTIHMYISYMQLIFNNLCSPFQNKLGIMHLPTMAMKIPTWVTLQKFEMEFKGVGWEIASNLERLLGFDKWTFQSTKQSYYIALEIGNGWEITLEVKNEVNGGPSIMLINYDYVPIKHKFCLEAFHRVIDCPTLAKAKVGAKKINEQRGVD